MKDDFIIKWSSYPTITAALASLQQEVRHSMLTQDNLTKERDKIKSDLQVNNFSLER